MGIFSSKKKVNVNVTVQKLFEESQIPDSARQGLMKGVLSNGSMVDNMLEDLSNSVGLRANTGMSWAKKNDYYFGIPTSSTKSNMDACSSVLSAIASNVGQAITPVYYTMGPMNSFHYAWVWLVNTHGYNPDTNEIVGQSAAVGKKCYLSGMVATYTKESYDFMVETYDLGMVDQLGPPPTSGFTPSNPFTALQGIGPYNKQPTYEVSSVAVEDYVTITYEYEDSPGVIVTHGLTLALTAVDLTADFHQARYVKADGKTGFFTYQQGSGTYPGIDQIFDLDFNNLGTFYPWVYFRVNNQQVSRMNIRKPYNDASKYCDYLGVGYDMLDAKVEEDPNVADVAQSMIMFALHPGEQNSYCMQYLFAHFNALHTSALSAAAKANDLEEKFNVFTTSPSQVQSVRDKFFAMNFQFSGISKLRKPGKIGRLGSYNSEYAIVGQNDQRFYINGADGVTTGSSSNGQPAWIYRKQVTDSVYEEIAVYGLRANYAVHAKKGFGAGAKDDALLIPVDRELLNKVSVRGKEQIITRGLHFFVSTVQIISTPWYASGGFKIIMIVVAVVITIFSVGTTWQTIVAAAALGATALAIVLINYIVTALVINYAVKLFVKEFGPQLGIIAAIAAMAVGAYGASTNATWGESLIAVGSSLATTSSEVMQATYEDIMADIERFQAYARGEFNSLEDAKQLAGLNAQYVGLEPLEMVYRVPDIRIGEAPNDFYNRTVHSGNIGVASYDLIERYVDVRLTLPTLADTEGEVPDDGLAV